MHMLESVNSTARVQHAEQEVYKEFVRVLTESVVLCELVLLSSEEVKLGHASSCEAQPSTAVVATITVSMFLNRKIAVAVHLE